jgi:hypothetical protein
MDKTVKMFSKEPLTKCLCIQAACFPSGSGVRLKCALNVALATDAAILTFGLASPKKRSLSVERFNLLVANKHLPALNCPE